MLYICVYCSLINNYIIYIDKFDFSPIEFYYYDDNMKICNKNIISIILYVMHYNNGITSKLILIKSEQRNKHFAPATTDCNKIYSDRKTVLNIQKNV